MTWTQTWFIDGKILAQDSCKAERVTNEIHPPMSRAYFCPRCGDVWARRIIDPPNRWIVLTHECPKHIPPRYCEPGGSVWVNYDPDFLQNLPINVLHYETLLRLDLDK